MGEIVLSLEKRQLDLKEALSGTFDSLMEGVPKNIQELLESISLAHNENGVEFVAQFGKWAETEIFLPFIDFDQKKFYKGFTFYLEHIPQRVTNYRSSDNPVAKRVINIVIKDRIEYENATTMIHFMPDVNEMEMGDNQKNIIKIYFVICLLKLIEMIKIGKYSHTGKNKFFSIKTNLKMLGFVKSLDILNSEISQRDENKNFGILTFDYRGLIESEVLLQKKCSEYFEKLNQKNPSQSLIQKQS
jgi:hypothetical protein